MTPQTVAQLLALNRQFYETMGESFSATRQRLQPGVMRMLGRVPAAARVLDVGCGNGNAAAALARLGHCGGYVGVDFSRALLDEANHLVPPGYPASFFQADLAQVGWEALLPAGQFDFIFGFAAFHHLPGRALRKRVIETLRARLATGGRFVHSYWQFQNSARLRARIQPWEKAGLSPADVEPGDTLLDWRRGGSALRYVHLTSPAALAELAAETGFRLVESFFSDGEGGNLGLYQIWEYN